MLALQPAHCTLQQQQQQAVQPFKPVAVQPDLDNPNHNTIIMDSRPSMATCYLL